MPRRWVKISAAAIAVLAYPMSLVGGPIVQATTQAESDTRVAGARANPSGTSNLNNSNASPSGQFTSSQISNAPATETNPDVADRLNVDYSNGKLTINARGARLSDIFLAFHKATGARISGPTGTEELVFENICGAPDEVIADLLNGSPLQYIVVFSPVHTSEIEELILSEREPSKLSPSTVQGVLSLQTSIPKGIEAVDSARVHDAENASSTRSVVPDSISAAVVTTNSGVPDGWKPAETAPSQTESGASSSSSDGSKSDSTDKQLNAAGQYLQEMYRLRQQLPPGSGPTPH